MANLLTATLDDVARKRGDLYPITATLRANGAVANLTGATITITMVDNLTRALVVLGGACTITDAVNGKVSYQPVLADMDREGVLDVEFKEVLAGVTSHFPCADYSSLRLWPTLDLPPYIPPVAGINDHSISLLMMAAQTPGAVLIYDASGNAAVLADVAAGKVLTSNGVGVPPSYQSPTSQPTILDAQNLVAQGTLTTAAWVANAWSRIEIELFGLANAGTPANSNITLRANNDSSSKYGNSVNFHNTGNGTQTDAIGTPTAAFVAQLNTTTTKSIAGKISIWPKTATNRMRVGHTQFGTFPNSATTSEYYSSEGGFVWSDVVNDWTFSTIILGSGATFTGTMITRGYL